MHALPSGTHAKCNNDSRNVLFAPWLWCRVILKILKPSGCHEMLSTVQRKSARKFLVDFCTQLLALIVLPLCGGQIYCEQCYRCLFELRKSFEHQYVTLISCEFKLVISLGVHHVFNRKSLTRVRNDAVLLPTPASALSSRLHVVQDVRRLRNVHASFYHLLVFLLNFCLQKKV